MFTPAFTGASGDVYFCCYWSYMRFVLMLLLERQDLFTPADSGAAGYIYSCCCCKYRRSLLLMLLELQEMFTTAITGTTGDDYYCCYWSYKCKLLLYRRGFSTHYGPWASGGDHQTHIGDYSYRLD